MTTTRSFELEESGRLPRQDGVGQTLEGLADHHETTVGVPRPEVDVGKPALAPSVAPLRGQHDEIERAHGLDLSPCLAPSPRLVEGSSRLHHHALVTGVESGVEEGGG